MNETIMSVLLNYVICAVVGGLLEYIAPAKARKALRACVVAVMLVTTLSPVLHMDIDFSQVLQTEDEAYQKQYDALMHTANITEKKIYSEMKDILINSGVDEYEIYVSTSVNKDECTVYLEKIKIEVAADYSHKIPAIRKRVHEEYAEIFEIGIKNE